MKIVDLSRELYHRTPSYPGHSAIIHGVWKSHEESLVDGGNVHGLASMYFSTPDHGGTHIDAPLHFDSEVSRSTNTRWRNASYPASASISATSHRAPRSRRPTLKLQ